MPKKIKTVFRSYQGRHFFSRWLRKIFERSHVQQILGLSLMMVVFSLSVLTPQALAFVETIQINSLATQEEMPVETTTEVTFRYPLTIFDISQGFSWRHWGLDLTAPEGTPIYPIAKGKVMEVGQSAWGYGNYLLIDHQNGQRSLYAHLSKQESKVGDLVDKETTIGLVGHTGWATGNHLHLEIYENGLPLNPLEVLPEK
ncbi:MAG: M23 family metallopeptidase [Patescibacteria group bacterium]|nr:M23 family metallopeptidase [Patescibacteria group bacterium]MCL5095634.1 M23 family metallopeptidase [Patescibacteria group bacterium]